MRVCNALEAVSSYCRMASVSTYSDQQAAEALRANPGVRQSSDDPTEATAQTVEYMCELVNDSLADGIVQRAAADACASVKRAAADASPAAKWWMSAGGIWWYAKQRVRFIHHSKLLVAWLNAPNELQLLIRPDALLKMREPKGDCAVFTTLICALADCAGLPWEIVTIACDPRQPGIYSHVYPRVILPGGRRMVMDASHGKYPGWEVPAEHTTAKAIWNQDGQQIEDEAPPVVEGVDMRYLFNMPGEGPYRGLGQDDSGDDGGDDLSGAIGALDPNAAPDLGGGSTSNSTQCAAGMIFSAAGECFNPALSPLPLPGASSSSGSSSYPSLVAPDSGAALASDINAILSGGTQIARTALGLPATPTTPISTTTLLIIGAVVVGGILLVSATGKRGR